MGKALFLQVKHASSYGIYRNIFHFIYVFYSICRTKIKNNSRL